MNKPHITIAIGYLIVMDENGMLHVYCDDCKFHPIFTVAGDGWRELAKSPHYRPVCPLPYKFDGSECMTAECLPEWGLDAYYADTLLESFTNSSNS